MNTIIFEYHDVTASDTLENFTKQKLDAVFKRFDFVTRADVFFKTENTSANDTGMTCGIRLNASGAHPFAESSHNTFQDAVIETINELTVQLRKRKEKMKIY